LISPSETVNSLALEEIYFVVRFAFGESFGLCVRVQ
jgi:hypothetical protein